MSDLISREDVMGAVQDHFNADGFRGYDDGQKMMDRIKALPSAETHEIRTETHGVCLDLIKREDAIEAFGLSEKTRKYGGDHSGYDTMMKYEIQDVLENLPSAEAVQGEWIDRSDHGRLNIRGGRVASVTNAVNMEVEHTATVHRAERE